MDSPFTPNPSLAAAVEQVIVNRRSIKPSEFSNQDVSDEIVWQMLESANWAPTHGMTEPWRFFVYSGEAKQKLGRFLAQLYEKITLPENIKPAKAAKLQKNAEQSSHLILIGMKRQDSKRIPEVEEVEAVACAVQNLHLTATAYGVAGYWSSGKAICNDELRDFVGLKTDDRILGLFYVGMPANAWPVGQRTATEEKVVWKTE